MRLSKKHLQDWVALPQDATEQLCAHSIETVTMEAPYCTDERVLIGRVLTCEKHPDAQRLNVTTVDVGQDSPLSIVCGCPSVASGMVVPVATHGARLPGGKIKKSKLRGQPSEGMLCSLSDLGFEENSSGLYQLPDDAPVGEGFFSWLGLDAPVYDFEITPNRYDCFSALGMAREIAAIYDLKTPTLGEVSSQLNQRSDVAHQKCSVFCTAKISGISFRTLPIEIYARLQAAGIASVNAVVDILNYAMLHVGQPMHAYDANTIEGDLRVQEASVASEVKTLQEDLFAVAPGDVVVCDDHGIKAVAGIIGDYSSRVTENTQSIIIESAVFDTQSVRKTVNRSHAATASSIRLSRGVDRTMCAKALEFACQLLVEHLGAKWNQEIEISVMTEADEPKISITLDEVNATLGTQLRSEEVLSLLGRLNFTCSVRDDAIDVQVPSYRVQDVRGVHDIIEEIVRMYGFNNLPAIALSGRASGKSSPVFTAQSRIRARAKALRYNEIVSYAFISEKMSQWFGFSNDEAVVLSNPLSSEYAQMRQSLLPSLLATASDHNASGYNPIRLFELGRSYFKDNEVDRMAFLACGFEHTHCEKRDNDFFRFAEEVLASAGLSSNRVQLLPAQEEGFHPGICAHISLDGQRVGVIGQLHPSLRMAKNFINPVYIAEVDLIHSSQTMQFSDFSLYPIIVRDQAYFVDKNVKFCEISDEIQKINLKHLRDVQVFDIYQEDESQRRSVALRFIFRHKDRNLTDEEVSDCLAKINEQLRATLDVTAR